MSRDTEARTPEAGREMDALIAERVMGEPRPSETPEFALERQLAGSPVSSPLGFWINVSRYEDGDVPTWWPLPFSTQITAAWRVVEAMVARGLYPEVTRIRAVEGDYWRCEVLGLDAECYIDADTAPLAMCRAAIAAIEGAS